MADVLTRARAAGWYSTDDENSVNRSPWSADPEALDGFHADSLVEARPTSASDHPLHTPSGVAPLRVANSPAQPLQQHMSALVQRLFLAADRSDESIRSVVFSAVDKKCDSALLVSAVAEILASSVTGRVCVIDANFDAPSLHRHYGVPNEVGLAQLLSSVGPARNIATLLAQGNQNSLWLLPTGQPVDADDPPLTTGASRARFRAFREMFDYVLTDAPPVTQNPAASILGSEGDGVVLVAEANVTRRQVARAAADTLRGSGARVLGTVLNNRTFPIPEALYRRL